MTETGISLKGMTIAFFHQSADLYGSDKVLLYLAIGVQQFGGKAIIILPTTGALTTELDAQGIEYHIAPVVKISRSSFSASGLFSLLAEIRVVLPIYRKIFSNRTIDIVHSNTVAVLGGAIWSTTKRIHHLWHVHEIIERPRVASTLFPLLLRLFSDSVVCASKANLDWVVKMQSKLKNKTEIIWNGVNPPSILDSNVANALHEKFRPPGTSIAIGLLGRINRWKGQSLLIDAAEILYENGVRDFSIIIMGSPPPGQEHFEVDLRERIKKSPIQDRIMLFGFEVDIWPVYAALDIVCVPSIEPEPFGLVAIEAMAMKKPVVASGFGGLVEIVDDGTTGFTFTPGDARSFAEKLNRLIGDVKVRTDFGNAARSKFDRNFSIDIMNLNFARKYLAINSLSQ